ncbi:putative beta-lysine N-acetyltransferase [Clostridium luticellarii]|uniref:N-acetyltransferase YodP n=1 Tax=Clostridium luticellarii TaxID=1691940 RepID=A0A2T0BQG7_9CLOT|nr:putative beta-lysine N-acetyltransferase [Clostridium luticellarii]PRR86082.1 N-acetyltransferase YodP [Clostridium luticellarii]
MSASSCQLNNYYMKIGKDKICVDYINSRVKIIKFHTMSVQNIKRLIHFVSRQRLGKIICNCDIEYLDNFIKAGFELEGKIDGYFKGKDAFCMSYFINKNRRLYSEHSKEDLILRQSLNKKDTFIYNSSNFNYHIRNAAESDIKNMIKLFSQIFSTYPSEIFSEDYLRNTLNKKVLYKVAVDNDSRIIGIASADLDRENLNAEITDCVTHPHYRNKGILSNIIYSLELELKKMGFITLYSLSRAIHPGINFVLSKQGYTFRGKLINNCNICGGFENMNIWVKNITKA